MSYQKELNHLLNSNEISAEEFAQAIGVTKGAVSHWVEGRRSIPPTVVRIIRMFQSNLDYMYYFKTLGERD